MPNTKAVVCPYCGHAQHLADSCRLCRGRFDAESRRATRGEMGPWFVRDPEKPFRPGCSHETIRRLVERGKITRYTVMRGPTTRQFWTVARRIRGIAHLLGYCHDCGVPAMPGDSACSKCRASFVVDDDRDRLGIGTTGQHDGIDDGFSFAELLRPEAMRSSSQGGQLSAFVADDEIDGGARPIRPSAPTDGGDPRRGDEARGDAIHAGGDEPIGQLTLEALDRSLRRTVQRQQRMIQALVVVSTLLAIIVVWVAMQNQDASTETVESHRDVDASSGQSAPRSNATPPPAPAPSDAPSMSDESEVELANAGMLVDLEREIAAEIAELIAEEERPIEWTREETQRLRQRLDELERLDAVGAIDPDRIEALREQLQQFLDAAELRAFMSGD